jgi:hypothetical protein
LIATPGFLVAVREGHRQGLLVVSHNTLALLGLGVVALLMMIHSQHEPASEALNLPLFGWLNARQEARAEAEGNTLMTPWPSLTPWPARRRPSARIELPAASRRRALAGQALQAWRPSPSAAWCRKPGRSASAPGRADA